MRQWDIVALLTLGAFMAERAGVQDAHSVSGLPVRTVRLRPLDINAPGDVRRFLTDMARLACAGLLGVVVASGAHAHRRLSNTMLGYLMSRAGMAFNTPIAGFGESGVGHAEEVVDHDWIRALQTSMTLNACIVRHSWAATWAAKNVSEQGDAVAHTEQGGAIGVTIPARHGGVRRLQPVIVSSGR